MPYSEAQKAAIYRYREAHPERWKEQQRKNNKTYYERNREACIARVKAHRMKNRDQDI
jgi:hypothetical protein